MAGTGIFAPHATIANLYVGLTDNSDSNLILFARCTGTPDTTANVFQKGALMIRSDVGATTAAVYQNTGTSASPVWTLMDTSLPGDTASSLIDTNSVTAMDVGTTASAVNNLRTTNSAANRAPILSTVGSSTNPGLQIWGKGSGKVAIGTSTAVGVVTLQGVNYIEGSGSTANTAVGTLTDANGVGIPLAAGLRVLYKTDSTLQAGANTFNLNGSGAKSVFKFNSPASNIKTSVLVGAILSMTYSGTAWLVEGFSQ